jgi:polynucleotide 5'-kinase involved in rRNA processing
MGTTGSYKRSPYTSVPWIPRPELDLLLDWWESGVEVPILVEGTAGAGKSRLLRVLAEEVAQRVRDPRAVL